MKRHDFFNLGAIGLPAMVAPSLIYAQSETKSAEIRIDNSNDMETKQFVREVRTTPQLLGVFTGHTHQARTVFSRNGGIQHITAPALNGQCRLVRINYIAQIFQ
jgi:hypothetical protein